MTQSIITLSELNDIIKDTPNRDHNDVCQSFLSAIEEAKDAGDYDFEISSRYTRSGNPYVIRF